MTWPAVPEAAQWLQSQGMSEADAAAALQAAGGRPGDALRMAGDAGRAAAWAQLPRQLAKGDVAALAVFGPVDAVEALQKICHDLMALAGGATPATSLRRICRANLVHAAAGRMVARAGAGCARTADHPFNAGLMMEALASRAQRY